MTTRHQCVALAATLISSSLLVAMPAQAGDRAYVLSTRELPALPVPVANNAVASVTIDGTQYIISFAGLGPGRMQTHIHARVFVLSDKNAEWVEQAAVPGKVGRLAATAAAAGELAYVFGGYSVAADDTEVSTPWVHSFDPLTSRSASIMRTIWKRSPAPVPNSFLSMPSTMKNCPTWTDCLLVAAFLKRTCRPSPVTAACSMIFGKPWRLECPPTLNVAV